MVRGYGGCPNILGKYGRRQLLKCQENVPYAMCAIKDTD